MGIFNTPLQYAQVGDAHPASDDINRGAVVRPERVIVDLVGVVTCRGVLHTLLSTKKINNSV